jgi:hypothetical protein
MVAGVTVVTKAPLPPPIRTAGRAAALADGLQRENHAMRQAFLLVSILLGLAPGAAWAGNTSYQTSLVPDFADPPTFRANGSSIKIVSVGNVRVMGKLKGVVDADGDPVTTDEKDPNDVYCVEIDVFVQSVGNDGTASMSETCFDVKNGNAHFRGKLGQELANLGAQKGNGVTVREIRVFDSGGNRIGSGGVALRN